MRNNFVRHNPLVSADVHPFVYAAIVGLALWFAAAVWSFAGDGYTDYLLVVVSGFVLVAVALPYILSWVGRKGRSHDARQARDDSFREWAAGDLDIWQDRLKGANAATEMLLPIAAVAFGMTAFGIVLHFTSHGAV
jgi:hypothetical protein